MLYTDTQKSSSSEFSRSVHAKKAFSTPPWTRKEDELVRRLYPDYNAMNRALPRRSRCALKRRVQVLNIPINVERWTAPEAKKLETLARQGATLKEIAGAFECSVSRIKSRLKYQRVRLAHRTTRKCKYPIFDAIRSRAIEFGSIAALDKEANTGVYFRNAGNYRPDWKKVERALEILGGELKIKWCEEE